MFLKIAALSRLYAGCINSRYFALGKRAGENHAKCLEEN